MSTALDDASNPGSLRYQIMNDNPGDTIQFASSLAGKTIKLTNGVLEISKPLTISGLGAGQLTVDGTNNSFFSDVFKVDQTASGSTIRGLTISGGQGGGAALDVKGTLTIINCTFSGNQQFGGMGNNGGTVYFDGNYGGKLTIEGSSFSQNSTAISGAIGYDGTSDGSDSLVVKNCTFSGNSGAVSIFRGRTVIENSQITNSSGWGILNDNGIATITASTISGNDQGGIRNGNYSVSATMTLVNSTVVGNGSKATSGGGIYNEMSGVLTIYDSTITSNSASGTGSLGGGGVYNENNGSWGDSGTVVLNNAIVANNYNSTSPDIYGPVTANYSLIGDTRGAGTISGSGDILNQNALLGILGNYGGPTQTIPLLAGSPAIDHGSNTLAQAAGMVGDQRGLYRIYLANGTVDIGAYEKQPDPSTQDALGHQVCRLSPATFDGAGIDVTLWLGNVVAGQQVQVSVGKTLEDLRSVRTFTNSGGASPWLLSIDIHQANPTLAEVEYVAVGSSKPLVILSAVGLHPNMTDLSGSGYQQHPAVPGSQPSPPNDSYSQVAQLYRWDSNSFVLQSDWTSLDWTRKTIIVTHGWNGSLNGADFIREFAKKFTTRPDATQYDLLAIDWTGHGDSNLTRLGSDPNAKPLWQDLIVDWGDAATSAGNAVLIGQSFGQVLLQQLKAANRPINPSQIMLIGHSNGTALMASLAIYLKALTGTNVGELDALDAPTATIAWNEVRSAATSTNRLANYYMPVLDPAETPQLVGVSMLALGVGAPIYSSNVYNFMLDDGLTQRDLVTRGLLTPLTSIGHLQLPERYAETATTNANDPDSQWGFQTSAFNGSSKYDSSYFWTEEGSIGHFDAALRPTLTMDDLLKGTQAIYSVGSQLVTSVHSLWDSTVRVEQDLTKALKGAGQDVSFWISSSLSNVTHFLAHSPVYGSVDVNVPSDADFLTFNLSVTNPGNNDHLLVMIGNDVVQDIDLASAQSLGGVTEQVWINNYAGKPETVTFYMPSSAPSSADLSIADVNFIAVDLPPVSTWNPSGVAFSNSTVTFSVIYTDADDSVKYSSIDANDILVTGPSGFSHLAALVGVDQIGDGSTRTATYRITAPGAAWTQADTGTYTLWMQSNQVSDTSGKNYVVSGALGAFNIVPPAVTAKNLTATGLTMQFSSALDASQMNLYDQGGTLGPADVVLMGSTTGVVNGSVVMNSAGDGFTFIKTGGVLAPDTYTVALRSAANGFKGTTGLLLDGNGDGTAGDSYTGTPFTVTSPASNAVTVSLPDFARGYGQPVNLPANVLTAGLPLTLSNGLGVSKVQFELYYDPTLLSISAFTLDSAVAARGATAMFMVPTAGTVDLTINSPVSLSATVGSVVVGAFTAQVPNNSPYGAKEILDITSLHVYDDSVSHVELPAFADDAIHVAAYFGDTSGSGSYNSPDTTLIRRLIGQVQTGLLAYPLADPVLIAHVSPTGSLGSTDTTRIRRAIGQIPVAEIPSLPVGLTPPAAADPKVYIPTDLTGHAGDTITVPVKLEVTEPGGITVSNADIVILFDASKFTVTGAQLGGLITGIDQVGTLQQPAAGTLIYTIDSATSTTFLSQGTVGNLLTLTVTIAGNATNGPSPINLVPSYGPTVTAVYDASLNALTLNPVPTNTATDSVDGVVSIGIATQSVSVAVSPLSVAEDGSTNLSYTFTRTGTTAGALTVSFTVGGTGTFSTDYTQSGAATFSGTAGTVVIPDGSSTAVVTIDPTADNVVEPDETVLLTVAAGSGYTVGSPSVANGTILNDDVAGIAVNPTSGLVTTEAGGTATFTVKLNTQPTANVTIGLSSSDTTEGTVAPSSLTFTPTNWSTAQTVTVTGVDDQIVDGDVAYTIVTAAATSTDTNYSGLNAADVSVTNYVNQRPSVLRTTVNGGLAQRSAIGVVAIRFNEDVSASLGADDLTLRNDTNGMPIDLTGIVPSYDPDTNTATWNIEGVPLPDGWYTATLSAAGVTDDAGNPLASGDYAVQFFRLLADTDGNASVDIFDVANVQTSYGMTSGATPAQGDFDGNGTVDIFDVALLQVQYGKTLVQYAPMNLGPTINSAFDDGGAELSADGLSMVFFSDRPGGKGSYDIWMATRSNVAAPFGTPVNLESINTSYIESGPSISTDGLTLVFHSTRPGGLGSGDIWMASRATTADPFGSPVNLGSAVNSSDWETVPDISADGLTLVFTSLRPGGQGSSDLWMAIRLTIADPFLPAINLGSLVNSSEADGGPELSADGLTLYFHSKRASGLGNYDLWKTTRATKNDPFGAPVHLDAPLNSVYLDANASLTADSKTLFFDSSRPGGQGLGDIWQWRLDLAGGMPARAPLSEETLALAMSAAWPAPTAETVDQDVREPLLSAMPSAADDLTEAIAMTRVSKPTSGMAAPMRPAASNASTASASVDRRHVRRNGTHAAHRPMQPLAVRHAVENASWESAVDRLLESEELELAR